MIELLNDGTLGDVPLLRTFELRLSGTFLHPYFGGDANGDGIRDTLNAAGWNIETVQDASTNWFPQQTGFSFIVVGNVGTNYTDRQIQDQMQADLGGFFSVSGISMISAPWTPPYSSNANTATGGIQTGGANYSQTGGAPAPSSGGSLLSQSALNNFAQGLGISTPVAVAGGLLVLLVLLKK